MKKRWISFLLAVVMVLGMVPSGVMAEPAPEERVYTQDLTVCWGENGEHAWYRWYDPDTGRYDGDPVEDLPAGVSWENNVLTLNGAELRQVRIDNFGPNPVTIRVEGENRIENGMDHALWIGNCFDVTLEGSGNLELRSQMVPFCVSSYDPDTGLNGPDNALTIRDITLKAEMTRPDEEYTEEETWYFNAVTLEADVTILGAKLELRGHNGLDVSGDLTIGGGAEVYADGFYVMARWKDPHDESAGYYPSTALIEDAVLRINSWHLKKENDFFTFDILPGCTMTIREGADILVDCSKVDRDWQGFIVHDDFTGRMTPGVLYLKGGRIEVHSSKVDGCSGFHVATGAKYFQSGGEVIVHAYNDDVGFSVWDDALFEMTGGSITVKAKSQGMGVGFRNVWNHYGGDITIELATDTEGSGLWVGRDTQWSMTDGSLVISNDSEAIREEFDPEKGLVHGIRLDQGSELLLTGGEIRGLGEIGTMMNLQGDMLLAGGELSADTDYTGILFCNGGTMTVAGGELQLNSRDWAFEITGGSGLSVLGGKLDLHGSAGIWLSHGNTRFLGGETVLRGEEWAMFMTGGVDSGSLSFGDGVHAAYDDGTEAVFEEQIMGFGRRPVTIRRQGVAGAETALLMDLTATGTITAGVPTGVRIVPMLTAPMGVLEVELPEGATLAPDSLLCLGQSHPYTLTEKGFTTEVTSGDLLSFTIQPMLAGEQAIVARTEGLTQKLKFECSQYRLTLPERVADPVIRTSGTAVAGGALTFYEGENILGTAQISSLGTWSAELTLPDVEGWYNVYGILQGPDGEYLMITDFTQILYDADTAEIESLTISNWIHGNTAASPNKLTKTVIDYRTGTTTPGYYVYWPDLPEFTFEADFTEDGTPEKIYNVRVIATDRRGREQTVPLRYDAESGTWKGTQDFCTSGTIIPESFRVSWSVYEWWEEPQAPVWVPDEAPEATEEDSATGGMLILPPGTAECSVRLSADAQVEELLDGPGNDVAFTITDDVLRFPVVPGEVYVLRLKAGSFADYPGERELNILVQDETPRNVVEYRDNVYMVSSEELTELTDSSFRSDDSYRVGDVLIIDDLQAVALTGRSGDRYGYTAAALDQVFARLDVSGIDTTQPLRVEWDVDQQTLEEQFRQSPMFGQYLDTLEYTVQSFEEKKEIAIEIEDTSVSISLTYGCDKNGDIYVKPVFKAETKMKTKLPVLGEQETTVSAEFYYEVREHINYRLRSDNLDQGVQVYYLYTDETITDGQKISVSIGDDGEPQTAMYFSDKLQEELYQNYLETLEGGEDNTLHLIKDLKIYIPTPASPVVNVYVKPAVDLEWDFFGEVSLALEKIDRTTMGIIAVHLGDSALGGWDVRTFCESKPTETTVTAELHLKASVGLMLKGIVGVSAVDCLDVGLYAKVGPVLSGTGHGTASWSSLNGGSASAELFEVLSLDTAIGAVLHIHMSKFPLGLEPIEYDIFKYSYPLFVIGERVMPHRFTNVEKEPVVVTWQEDLKQRIDLSMDCQNFNFNQKIFHDSKVMDLSSYTFELVGSAPVTLTKDGKLTVKDTKRAFDFKVRVIYTGSDESYKLWKVVPMRYAPTTLTINKTAECPPPVAGFMIINLTDPREAPFGATTNTAGTVTVELTTGCVYLVKEVSAPPCNRPVPPTEQRVYAMGAVSAGFANECNKDDDPDSPEIPVPPIADPSGFVFEGIESNRLSGVTVTLYQADDDRGTNARLWNSEPFDQKNPLTTDQQGQYLWMVPEGWWQVRYELEGYDRAESEWMVVPPIRTEVNQALVSDAPAAAQLRYSQEAGFLVLEFDRPILINSISSPRASVDGVDTEVWPEPLDAAWSVTEDPIDSRMCATAFRLNFPEGTELADSHVTLTMENCRTYHFVDSGVLSASAWVPRQTLYHLTVENGRGTGYYSAGETVTVSAYPHPCREFREWMADGVTLADPVRETITFTMPDHEVFLSAGYAHEGSHQWQGLECVRCGELRDNPFTDVAEGTFYYAPVLWAVREGITNGTTETTFGPNDQCMRAHVVTFLWRAAGSPEPIRTENPFVDVKESDFFYKAVLWAVENGITAGMDATHFGPFSYCNRAQVVTFLYRTMGSPAVDQTQNPFADVPAGSFYFAPVLWAVDHGITNGISATAFGPNTICNRAQIVTFLYRAYG